MDPLTGLESRGHFEQLLDERLATESGSFSLLQFTVDHMPKYCSCLARWPVMPCWPSWRA
jgi:hypothetical protein